MIENNLEKVEETYPFFNIVKGLSRNYMVRVQSQEEVDALQVAVNLSYDNSVCRKTGSYCGGNCSEYDCYGH